MLEACSSIKKIYLLIRGRQGVSAQTRFDKDVLSLEIFQNIFKLKPYLRDILYVVEGDISEENLGISDETTKKIQSDTTVVLHCAATTKFQETLKLAVELNTLGPKRALELSKGCKNLIAHVHVSTAYVNCIHNSGDVEIKEKVYPIRVNVDDFLERISTLTVEQAHEQTEKLIAPYPNTYTFTKALGEHLIISQKENIPVCFVRPSIVGCANAYPIKGWVDSMIGANGLLLALGVGALHSMRGNPENVCDFIPVDTVAMLIISAAWRTARQYGTYPFKDEVIKSTPLPIYHCATSSKNPVLWSWIRYIVSGYFSRHPPKRSVGRPWAIFTKNSFTHFFAHLMFHQFPSYMADIKRLIQRKPLKMVKATERLHSAISALCYFTDHQWFYSTENVDELISEMNDEDRMIFPVDVRDLDWEIYFVVYAEGIRKFLLKESDFQDDISPQLKSRL